MAQYIVTPNSIVLEASSEEEALEIAQQMLSDDPTWAMPYDVEVDNGS